MTAAAKQQPALATLPASRMRLLSQRDVLIMVLIVAGLGWPVLTHPLGLDQGIYAANACRMLDGHALYSGAWDMKSPGIFFMYAAVIAIGGYNVWPIMLAHLVIHGLAGGLIFRLMTWWTDRATAWTSAVVYWFVALSWTTPITNAQPDDWMIPFFLGGLFLIMAGWCEPMKRARWCWFIAGVAIGWTAVLRSLMAVPAVALPLVTLIVGKMDAAREKLYPAVFVDRAEPDPIPTSELRRFGVLYLCYAGGGALITGLLLLYHIATGSLNDMLYTQLVWVKSYAQTYMTWGSFSWNWIRGVGVFQWATFFENYNVVDNSLLLTLVGCAIALLRGQGLARWAILPWAWGLIWVTGVMVAQVKFFNYHFWPLLPFLLMGASFGIVQVFRAGWDIIEALMPTAYYRALPASWTRCATHYAPRVLYIAAWIAFWCLEPGNKRQPLLWGGPHRRMHEIGGLNGWRKRADRAGAMVIGRTSYAHYIQNFNFHHIYRAREDEEIAQYILARTPLGESPRMFIWGFRPAIYFLCGVVSPSRFPYNLPLRAEFSPPEWMENLEAEFRAADPEYIVLGIDDQFQWVVGDYHTSWTKMPAWMETEIRERFHRVMRLKFLELWVRNRKPGDGATTVADMEQSRRSDEGWEWLHGTSKKPSASTARISQDNE